eukprot:239770_1
MTLKKEKRKLSKSQTKPPKSAQTKPPKRSSTKSKTPRKPPPKLPPKSPTTMPLKNGKRSKQNSNHRKAKSLHDSVLDVSSIYTPQQNHPSIGEYLSSRARQKQLLRRTLPSIPKDVDIYFILMGKIYKEVINICLDSKLSHILPKLSYKIAYNKDIQAIIARG